MSLLNVGARALLAMAAALALIWLAISSLARCVGKS